MDALQKYVELCGGDNQEIEQHGSSSTKVEVFVDRLPMISSTKLENLAGSAYNKFVPSDQLTYLIFNPLSVNIYETDAPKDAQGVLIIV